MEKDRLSGKLAVILHADVVDSTQLVQVDEHLAHERIQETFDRFGKTISRFSGRILEQRGDALLAEFGKPSDAVAATLAFQSSHVEFLESLEDSLKPEIRVGIAMGEVVIADNTVTGAGVVLAQRVEQLAVSGGLCITAAIHEALSKRLPFDLEDIGEQDLKGFDYPVRVYRINLRAGASIPEPDQDKSLKTPKTLRPTTLALSTVAIVFVAAFVLWYQPWQTREEPASVDNMLLPLPDKPSIAVLPFTNMSGDPEQEYFTDGMTEDLITDLSKISGLFVIARNSSFSYKGKPVKVRQVGEELGVRYVMEGSVRRAGDQVRINAQLIDATTGGHLWAERYDGSLQDVFALTDQVTEQIVSALKVNLTAEEKAQQAQHSTDNAEAHDAFLQGWAHYKLGGRADLVRSIPFLEEAVHLDPGYADAHAVLATIYWDAVGDTWTYQLGIPKFEVEDRANFHLQEALKKPNLLVHVQQSRIYLFRGLYEKAAREAEIAASLDPNSASAHAALANTLVLTNRAQEGLDAIRKAIRLDPFHPADYLTILGAAQFGLEDYAVAATSFERAIKRKPDSELSLIYLASSYGHLGDMKKAEKAIKSANEIRAKNLKTALKLGGILIAGIRDCKSPQGNFEFSRFGPPQIGEHLRVGLWKIPMLNLAAGSDGDASGQSFDSAMGEWKWALRGDDCILVTGRFTFVDEAKVAYPPYRNTRVLWSSTNDPHKWEGYWVDDFGFDCGDKMDGSAAWGAVTFRFNETYTEWKGDFDICGKGTKFPWNGFR